MILKKIADVSEIKAVLCNEVIYDTITGDTCPSSLDFEPPVNDDYLYIGGYVKGEIIALMVYHKYKDGTLFCHVQVLPDFRKSHALEFGRRSLKFKGECELYAVIPNIYRNVLRFADAFGFVVVGKIEEAGVKNGKSFDEYVLKYICD